MYLYIFVNNLAIISGTTKSLPFSRVILLLEIYPKEIPLEKDNTIYASIFQQHHFYNKK